GYLINDGNTLCRRQAARISSTSRELFGAIARIGLGESAISNPDSRNRSFTNDTLSFKRWRSAFSCANVCTAVNAAPANGSGNGVLPTKRRLLEIIAWRNPASHKIAPP